MSENRRHIQSEDSRRASHAARSVSSSTQRVQVNDSSRTRIQYPSSAHAKSGANSQRSMHAQQAPRQAQAQRHTTQDARAPKTHAQHSATRAQHKNTQVKASKFKELNNMYDMSGKRNAYPTHIAGAHDEYFMRQQRIKRIIFIVCAVLVLLLLINGVRGCFAGPSSIDEDAATNTHAVSDTQQTSEETETVAKPKVQTTWFSGGTYNVVPLDFDSISGDATITTFFLAANDAASTADETREESTSEESEGAEEASAEDSTEDSVEEENEEASAAVSVELSAEETAAIQEVLTRYNNRGVDVGFVFTNLSTGKGITYNADDTVYGASSFKGPFCAFLGERILDTGLASQDTYVRASMFVDGLSGYSRGGSYALGLLVEDVLVNSGNDAYQFLRSAYEYEGFPEYLTSLNIPTSLITDGNYGGIFPHYNARQSAKLWAQAYMWLKQGSENARWMAEFYKTTDTSFIRDAIQETGATTYTKAGWCTTDYSSPDGLYDSLCDAGLICIDGQDYLLTVMSGAPETDTDKANLHDLIVAVFAARASLD